MATSIKPSDFQESHLCDLSFEEAFKIGASKNAQLDAREFKETSIRFRVYGLRDWFSAFVDDHIGGSVYRALRDASWQCASFCEYDPELRDLWELFSATRRRIAEETAYVDLMERLRQPVRMKEFVAASQETFVISVPMEVVGIMGRLCPAVSLSFSSLFQICLVRCLAASRSGLYGPWMGQVGDPLVAEFQELVRKKSLVVREIEQSLEYRLKNNVPLI